MVYLKICFDFFSRGLFSPVIVFKLVRKDEDHDSKGWIHKLRGSYRDIDA